MFERKKLNPQKFPNHIAFIIDGNGRWAKKRGLPRSMGHGAGIKVCQEIIDECYNLGLKNISIYGFSTENWNRPKDEIDTLFELFRDFIKKDMKELLEKDVKFIVSGDYTAFPSDLVEAVEDAIKKTKDHKGMIVNLCINYGSRPEILRAVNNIIKDGIKDVDAETFNKYLYTSDLPDPDFIIRTSGENRLSNFMLWQASYSEFYFPSTYWPDFHKKELYKALINFSKRKRRFGSIKEN